MGVFAWLSIAHFALIAVIHVITAILDFRICKILEYLGISLHISAACMLLLANASLDVLLLSFMSSFLLYLICRILFSKVKEGSK